MSIVHVPCRLDFSNLAANLAMTLRQMNEIDASAEPVKLNLVDPFAVYTGDANDFVANQCASKLISQTAWRGLVLSEQEKPLACVEIFPPPDGGSANPVFAVRGHASADELMHVMLAADQFVRWLDRPYEVRFMTFPALFVTAVWLAGDDNWFIPVRAGVAVSPHVVPLTSRVFSVMVADQIKRQY
jgi:hypothetical protein